MKLRLLLLAAVVLLVAVVLALAWPEGTSSDDPRYSEQAAAARRERVRREIEREFLSSEARLKAWFQEVRRER